MTRSDLRRLARLHGLMPTYVGADGRVHSSGEPALRAALRVLGCPIDDHADIAALEHGARLARWQTVLDPVVTAWRGRPAECSLRLPQDTVGSITMAIELESGGGHAAELAVAALPVRRRVAIDGRSFLRYSLPLPASLPLGYHRLRVHAAGDEHVALLIVAPERAMPLSPGSTALFVPLYALRSARSPDCADLSDWGRLADWAATLGMSHAGALPLCAQFLDAPPDTGPYAPASRLFWNEAYLDLDDIPGAERVGTAAPPADPRRVDWGAVAADRIARLQSAADRHFATFGPDGGPELAEFVAARPLVAEYARFRAAGERYGRNWRDWPAALRAGRITPEDVDAGVVRRHLFAQWLCDRQLRATTGSAHRAGLYLDLPVGVHPDGFDAWRYQGALLDGSSAGAPPDPFFTGGQSWGFPPVDPHGSRHTGHAWLRDCLRQQFEHASLLRIDHVMGLNRIWLVPAGSGATEGCYLRQPAEELFAIVTLESQRRCTAVIGEDLGTVPIATARRLARHGLGSMRVFQFGVQPGRPEAGTEAPRGGLIALNTHDMPTFAAFWAGDDIVDRERSGLLDAGAAAHERGMRARMRDEVGGWLAWRHPGLDRGDTTAVLDALLVELARSDAAILVIGLEDLWLEREPQNVPGTLAPDRNWCRRTAPSLDEIVTDERLAARLCRILEARDRHGPTQEEPQRSPPGEAGS